jgi:NAD(P)-dependent dehydrogenase (short-subunit alcohol dehydrogenase family)
MTTSAFDPRAHRPVPGELTGRTIAITGASSGLGRAVALDCARHGATVILIGRDAQRLSAAHADIEAACGRTDSTLVQFDLENALANDYDTLAQAISERFGRLDGLLHSAAQLGRLSPIEHYDVPTWCRVLQVNLTAAFALTQVLLPLLKHSADASVVFTSSSVGRTGRAHWGAYAVSKAALENLVQVMAAELSGITRVRVNALNPGPTRTLMRRQAYPAEDAGTLPLPEDLTTAYLALLGPASRGVSGGSFDAQ